MFVLDLQNNHVRTYPIVTVNNKNMVILQLIFLETAFSSWVSSEAGEGEGGFLMGSATASREAAGRASDLSRSQRGA